MKTNVPDLEYHHCGSDRSRSTSDQHSRILPKTGSDQGPTVETMVDVTILVGQVLAVFILGLGVRIVTVRSDQIVHPVALVPIGVAVAVTPFELGLRLSHDFIMIGLLPILSVGVQGLSMPTVLQPTGTSE